MNNIILGVLLGFVVIIVHELGHYIAYRFFGYKPDIKFKSGVLWIGENISNYMTPKQLSIVAMSGILAGLLPVLALNNYFIMLYLLVSMFDIISIYQTYLIDKKYLNLPLYKVNLLMSYDEYNNSKTGRRT